jgi:hypothetical protein
VQSKSEVQCDVLCLVFKLQAICKVESVGVGVHATWVSMGNEQRGTCVYLSGEGWEEEAISMGDDECHCATNMATRTRDPI